MTTPLWKHLGFVTPDALECQQDVWALLGRRSRALARVLTALAERTAEPSWGAVLVEGAERQQELGGLLDTEAGDPALERITGDEVLAEFESSLEEVLESGHVPSLLAAGYGVLGVTGSVPAYLLDEVAGAYSQPICERIVAAGDHDVLGRLMEILHPDDATRQRLGRLLHHLFERQFSLYASWCQSFHTLGVDGEILDEQARLAARGVLERLELPIPARLLRRS